MKKFITLFLIFLYCFLPFQPCFAISELYYLENIKKNDFANNISNTLQEKGYNIKKSNPFLALSNKKPEDYSIIILQQDGKNLYYYFESNTSSKKLNKTLLKNLKGENISYKKSDNNFQIENFSQKAKRVLSGEEKEYSFEQPKEPEYIKPKEIEQEDQSVLKGYVGNTGKGTELKVSLQNSISTATANVNDVISAVLMEDWITNDNYIIAPQGSLLYGKLTKAKHAKSGMRNGYVQLSFNQIVTPEGKVYDLETKQIDFNVTNDGKLKRTVAKAMTASVIGAAIGLAFALAAGGDASSMLSGAAIGAGLGAGTSAISSAAEKGIDAEIPAFTNIEVILTKDINIVIQY